ncbi:MAG TPA: potassium-transporting ATPase subunit KdpC [Stellaceae bacterium]|jgi:K+-transporting ATPase ATPase C chain|nr:potassium-transporting ATPase subunit KdpC [Stellaceae bacterium]
MLLKALRPALVLLFLLTLVTGVIYPYAITGISSVVFPHQAGGSLVSVGGKVVGSALIGQDFESVKYFHGRPSATTGTDAKGNTVPQPYNAASSAASNYGPTSKVLMTRVADDTKKLKAEAAADGTKAPVPVDLVTTSASGLDPDITPAAAYFQAARVADARHLPLDKVRTLIAANTSDRALGFLGEPHVNVLALNLALDKLAQ